MSRLANRMLATLFLVWIATVAQAAEKPGATNTQPGDFQVKFSKGKLSVHANEAPIAKVFEEVGKQAAITVDSGISPEEKITIKFDIVPLEDAIKQLAKNVSFAYAQDSNKKN